MTHPVTAADGLAPPATEPDHRDVDHDMAAMLPGSKIWAQADEDGEGWAVFVDRVMVAAYADFGAQINQQHAVAYRDQLIDQRDRIAVDRHRAEVVAGIRDLAEFLEQHPDVPLPHVGAYRLPLLGEGADPFRHATEAMLPLGAKVSDDEDFAGAPALTLHHRFRGGVTFTIQAYASEVCDTEEVTVMRPVIPAWARNDDQIAEAA